MADVEDEIAAKNLKVDYNRLTQEVPIKASELSEIVKKADTELASIKKQVSDEKESMQKHRIDIQNERLNHELVITKLIQQENELKESIQKISSDKSVSFKELVRINSQILQGTDSKEKLTIEVDNLNKEIVNLTSLKNEVELTTKEIQVLKIEKNKFIQEISTYDSDFQSKIIVMENHVRQLEKRADEAHFQEKQSQYRLKTYTDELYTHMNDYQVLKMRLEKHWKEVFPELDMPLL